MSTTTVVPCGCCKLIVEPAVAFFDTELQAHVCDDCRHHLRVAKAECSRSWSTPSGGLPSMPIGIRGVYHGVDAGDNLPTPPAQPETT